MNALAARRRHPAVFVLLLLLGLVVTGSVYAALAPEPAQASSASASPEQVEQGKKLFLANCATCHGVNAEGRTAADGTSYGPSLAGTGAAAVDFQVSTGRMPLAAPGVQAARQDPDSIKFDEDEIAAMAAYVASLAPGPAIPDAELTSAEGADIAKGGELFRVNCAMCHNFAGSGGALTRGKYAPSLRDIEGVHIYEAMLTGPQSMPVFNDTNLTPEDKKDVIGFLHAIDEQENPGGMALGNLGPVSEGLFIWVFGLAICVGSAVWLGSKAA